MDLKGIVRGTVSELQVDNQLDDISLEVDGKSKLVSLVKDLREQADQMVGDAPGCESRNLRFELDAHSLPQLEEQVMFFVKRRVYLDWLVESRRHNFATCKYR